MAGVRKRGGKAAPSRAGFTDDYFVYPHIFWMVIIPFGFSLLFIATFSPDKAFHLFPWPICDFVNYMGRSHRHVCIFLCVFAVVAHCLEAAYAGKICQDKLLTPAATAKWAFMTFLFGFASLYHLVRYQQQKAVDKQH